MFSLLSKAHTHRETMFFSFLDCLIQSLSKDQGTDWTGFDQARARQTACCWQNESFSFIPARMSQWVVSCCFIPAGGSCHKWEGAHSNFTVFYQWCKTIKSWLWRPDVATDVSCMQPWLKEAIGGCFGFTLPAEEITSFLSFTKTQGNQPLFGLFSDLGLRSPKSFHTSQIWMS